MVVDAEVRGEQDDRDVHGTAPGMGSPSGSARSLSRWFAVLTCGGHSPRGGAPDAGGGADAGAGPPFPAAPIASAPPAFALLPSAWPASAPPAFASLASAFRAMFRAMPPKTTAWNGATLHQ